MLKIVAAVILCYLGLNLYAFLYSKHHIFLPPKPSYKDNPSIIKLRTKDGATISAVYLKNKSAKYTLLISHGNGEDLGYIYPLLKELRNQNFNIFAYDYEGYGTSSGHASVKKTYQDITAAYDYLTNELQTPPEKIIGYGLSVGSGVTTDLAIRKKLAGVILQSPFVSAYRVITHIPFFLFDKYNNLKKIAKIGCPVLFIHGTADRIVPFWHSKKLFKTAKEPKYHLWIENAGHNNLIRVAGDRYWNAIQNFTKTLNNH